MKTTDTKTAAAQPAKKTSPFFKKGAGEGFFKPAAPAVQTKLTVGEPGDVYEKEADAMADQVVRKRPAEGFGADVGIVKKIQRKPIFESEADPVAVVQRKCAACEREEAVQRKGGEGAGTASASTESGITSTKGAGTALPKATQSHMESAFNADFSGVRIHDNSHAAQMNTELNAQAFTHGKDIYFNSGKYRPQNSEGQHLLAHELTHVVQQTGKGEPKKIAKSEKKIQRAAKKPAKPCDLTPGQASIADVTNKCPFNGGTITRSGAYTTIAINNLAVKDNVDEKYLAEMKLKLPLDLPVKGSRKDEPTKQISMWKGMVRDAVKEKLKSYIARIHAPEPIDDKLKPKNLYQISLLKSVGTLKLVGGFTQLVDECMIPKWNIKGKNMSFQVEHIMDRQIAGSLADNKANLMLLSADRNNELGKEILAKIRDKITAVLEHYNQYVPEGTLVKDGFAAQEKSKARYTIQAASLRRTKNNFAQDEAILKDYLNDSTQDNLSPLQKTNIKVESFDGAGPNEFLLKSGEQGAMIILPYNASGLAFGSYLLDITGDKDNGLKSLRAKFNPAGAPLKKDAPKNYSFKFKKVKDITRAYKVDNFGDELGELEIKYLSLVKFGKATVDADLNLYMTGMIDHPTPRFLKDTPIQVTLNGRDILINKTFEANELGTVGPISVDSTDLTVALSARDGFRVGGGIQFSIPKAGNGELKASTKGDGFVATGSFNFDPKTFKGSVTVTYDSTKDLPGKNPWAFYGTITVVKGGIKGIDDATVKIGYDKGELTFDGNANLNVPGVKSVTIKARFRNGQDFKFDVGAAFDFKNKYIQDPKLDVSIGMGGGAGDAGAGGDPNTGWQLSIAGSMTLKVPNLEDVAISVSYNNGEFDASVKALTIKVGEHVKGNITLGITNKPVDEATGVAASGQGGGKDLRLYGSGQVLVTFNEHLNSTVGVRLTDDGKVLVNGDLKLDKQPLAKGDKLYGDDYPLFAIESPEIPVFSIGVGDVYIRFGGGADANYMIGVPMISADLNMKDVDIHDPASMKLTTSITPEISASAGIKIWGSFTFGARVAVLKAEGTVKGSIGLSAETTFHPSLTLSWSPTEGLGFVSADINLDADIQAAVDLTGKVAVLLDFYFTSVDVWDKTWDLGHIDLGELGKISLNFPMKFGKDGIPVPPKRLTPETPFAKKETATDWMLNKPGGADKKVQGKSDEEIQKELEDDIRKLPALGPKNPMYKQMTSRDYVYHVLKNTPINLAPFLRMWYDIEAEEFEDFKAHVLQPASESKSKQEQVDEFTMNHVRVEPWKIVSLRGEISQLEASLRTSQAPAQPPEEPNSSPLPDRGRKI